MHEAVHAHIGTIGHIDHRKTTLLYAIQLTQKRKVQEEMEKLCPGVVVFTSIEFAETVKRGSINCFDGIGYFHDGTKETDYSVFDDDGDLVHPAKSFPLVCWYPK